MDRIRLLEAFVRVTETGSVTRAARQLGVQQSTVSKWLVALEAEVGRPLLERTTRALRVTDAGVTLRRHARTLLEGWDEALAEVRDTRVGGTLRVSVPAVFGARHVAPHVPGFLDAHPQVALSLSFADRYVRLLEEDLDVAIRVGASVDSSLRARTLTSTARRLVVAPHAALPHPVRHPRDLASVPCLVHSGVGRAVWRFRKGRGREVAVDVAGRFRCDHSDTLRRVCLAGHGVALLATWLVADDLDRGTLVALLPEYRAPSAPIRAVLPPSRSVPSRVEAWLDHLTRAWRDVPSLAAER
ncbi:MAG: LysR family transcriptional regulator [Myxococcota bacterium]